MITVYALVDPRTNEPKYVGQTKNPLQTRLKGHISSCSRHRRSGWKIALWNFELKKLGIRPIIMPLETVPKDEWAETERFWIANLKFIGAELLNDTWGGPGALGHIQSEEEKQKKRLSNMGKKRTDEAKKNISIAKQKLMRERPDIREKYAEMARNLPHTPEGRKKAADKLRNRPLSEWHKQRIRNSKVDISQETRDRLSKALKGRKLSEERKKAMSEFFTGMQYNKSTTRKTSSKYKGVCWDKSKNKWVATMTHDKKSIYLGRFNNEIDAAKAYDAKAKEICGDKAILNF